jgi:WD40 repeat protein
MKFLLFLFLFIHYCIGWCLKRVINTSHYNVSAIDYSPDGTKIAIGGMTDSTTQIYDA